MVSDPAAPHADRIGSRDQVIVGIESRARSLAIGADGKQAGIGGNAIDHKCRTALGAEVHDDIDGVADFGGNAARHQGIDLSVGGKKQRGGTEQGSGSVLEKADTEVPLQR